MLPSKAFPFRGIYAATLLPLDASGAIEPDRLAEHLRSCTAPDGIVGVLCNGHAGEVHLLTRAERRQVVEIASATIGASRIIVSGVLSESLDEAVAHARDAQDAGADAILVFPPFSWSVAQDAAVIVAHHEALARAVDIPVVLYQSSVGSGGMAYSAAILERLVRIPGVVAVKEGSWESATYDRNLRLVQRVAPQVEVMASGDEHLLPCFAIGTTGSMVSLAAVIPQAIVRLKASIDSGDIEQARVINEHIQPLANLIYGCAPGSRASLRLKACLVHLGVWPSARTRREAEVLSPEENRVLGAALEKAVRWEG
ncbi:dihydrodipicolinate synthase family protein [Komagataeibacter xylinus]|uniref:Dihydrodipicolinate synthase family protein n=1 Tax=Komagataeibacter xylinus TaxID=28448 RepID=A0A857FT32_KOMXY|nr:dihydrodipicolinate synthase family protein [Komagataeibacter xylinus]QHC35624.1 dihydrodipicolinate synthase family protein [Komagataeibacter xylinus]